METKDEEVLRSEIYRLSRIYTPWKSGREDTYRKATDSLLDEGKLKNNETKILERWRLMKIFL